MGAPALRARLGAVAAVVLVSLVTPWAVAQEDASGGGSFEEAPVLETGTYSDSIRSGETLFWAVELIQGERVHARATLRSPGDHPPAEAHLVLYNSLRREDELSADGELVRNRGRASLGTASTPVASSNTDYPEPGLHFVSLAVEGLEEPRQFDVTLSVDVAPGEQPFVDGREVVNENPPPDEPDPAPSRFGTYATFFAVGGVAGGLGLLLKEMMFGAGGRLRQGL